MSEKNLTNLAKVAYELAKKFLNNTGRIDPTFLFLKAEGGVGFAVIPEWADHDLKGIVIDTLREKFKADGVTDYILLSEAWFSRHDKDVTEIPFMPSEDPNRGETVVIGGTDSTGLKGVWLAEVRRIAGIVSLGPMVKQNPDEMSGAALSLLRNEESVH